VQNQQLGGRVYSRVYSSVCVAVQHIAEIIQAQAASSMLWSQLRGSAGSRDFYILKYTAKGTIQEKTTSFQKIYTFAVCLLKLYS
jgi:hypothetical protein